jgi:hypothetical protein
MRRRAFCRIFPKFISPTAPAVKIRQMQSRTRLDSHKRPPIARTGRWRPDCLGAALTRTEPGESDSVPFVSATGAIVAYVHLDALLENPRQRFLRAIGFARNCDAATAALGAARAPSFGVTVN